MKKYFFFLFLIALLSCKKNNNTPTPSGALSFKADGVMHSYSGDYKLGLGCSLDPLWISSLGYMVLTGVGAQNSDGFEAHLHTTAVEVKTYNAVEFEVYLSGVQYLISSNCIVTISKIENGRVTGNFSGKIARTNSSPQINITEGVFSDVLIR